jgi:hypothetical protein
MKNNPGVPFGSYPQHTARNQSQVGMRAPAAPPLHRAAGMVGGKNGAAAPVFAPAPCSISADMGTKVKSTVTMPGANGPPSPARGGFSDSR